MPSDKPLIYCRVPSQRQVDEGNGLGSQEFRCLQFAAQRGLEVERIFHERGVTGRGDFIVRPAMVELLRYLNDHPEHNYFVIFDDLKRFARDTLFHFKLKQELATRGATALCPNFKLRTRLKAPSSRRYTPPSDNLNPSKTEGKPCKG